MNKRIAIVTVIASILSATSPMVSAEDVISPYILPDDSFISLSGIVTTATEEGFILDYGPGLVTVEIDNVHRLGKADGIIIPGHTVRVYGEVDNDLYENTSIEASSVYVEDIGTYFYASTDDEEGDDEEVREASKALHTTPSTAIVVGNISLTGTVTGVDGREFTIDTQRQTMTVDTSQMPYDPMDDEGYQRITSGDIVSVTGNVATGTLEDRRLIAENVVTMERASRDDS